VNICLGNCGFPKRALIAAQIKAALGKRPCQALAVRRMLLLVLLLLLWIGERSHAARFNVMGHKNEPQFVRLKSQYDLTPETILKLPIDVPTEQLGLYGPLPPRLVNITSSNPNSIYGTGDVVTIQLAYTVPVLVAGTPTLTLNTGCSSSFCTIAEVQTFTCGAESGYFAIR
jgi:hypothetical protein